jgi:hypothetical protein
MKNAKTCDRCKADVKAWNERCGGCGFTLVLEPDEVIRARYLRTPSLGALLFTQGWAFGARLYLWFVLSLVPIAGLVVLFLCVAFGRRWSWEQGGWADWESFRARMRLLDGLAAVWIAGVIVAWILLKKQAG